MLLGTRIPVKVSAFYACLHFRFLLSMVMRPVVVAISQIGFNSILLPGGVTPDFAAFADSLVRLDMRTG